MDWSKTKSIFIATFFLLNLFLGYQLIEKQSDSNLNMLTQSTLQEKLQENEINIAINNSDEVKSGSPITGSFRTFNQLILTEQLENQEIEVLRDETIYSTLDTPYRLVEGNIPAVVNSFVEQYVLYGDQYVFTVYNEEEMYIGMHQTFEGRAIDNHKEGPFHLKINLNEDLEIISYQQMFMDISPQGREQDLLSPVKVIEILFNDNYIPANTTIEEAELGFYNPLQGMVDLEFRVFAPMWRVLVQDTFYFVNAINGEVQPINIQE
ncbi:two-component system regulatory protein YycI [Evansella tamaricis]|uniref:Two-component system regulatory protein YycI n=1 Tax=Evansella tamaricis TaxID=2069301 RepID=A0ABS6JDH3_9BACI|nr:two-component system regulatory protein YycI [Evansella tamaricis]MBU9710902.1 two-component system regulatory protein YycI [Evansella tamaricis]